MASTKTALSNIAMAFAAKADADRATKPRSASTGSPADYDMRRGARTWTASTDHGLPTPPDSISPNLPAQAIQPLALPPPAEVDSDIDLQDAADHADSQKRSQHGPVPSAATPFGLDTAGLITPEVLAKLYLPDILLQNGPIAIRHVMSYLSRSAPGFSFIPPAKARRLVVGALESKEGGGTKGNVVFEKVGWGRWDARLNGQPSRDQRARHENPSPPPSAPSSYSPSSGDLKIPRVLEMPGSRGDQVPRGSRTASSAEGNHDEDAPMDMTMAEHEADKMSLDEADDAPPPSCSSSPAPDDPHPAFDADMGDGDETDEEDWASIGAAALRQASFDARSGGGGFFTNLYNNENKRDYNYLAASVAKSVPARVRVPQRPSPALQRYLSSTADHDFRMLGVGEDEREREAVEALLRMGRSM